MVMSSDRWHGRKRRSDGEGRLEIGKGARVKGNVTADSLEVAGTIEGNVKTTGDIHVSETGKVNGDIRLEESGHHGGWSLSWKEHDGRRDSEMKVDLDVTELGTKTEEAIGEEKIINYSRTLRIHAQGAPLGRTIRMSRAL